MVCWDWEGNRRTRRRDEREDQRRQTNRMEGEIEAVISPFTTQLSSDRARGRLICSVIVISELFMSDQVISEITQDTIERRKHREIRLCSIDTKGAMWLVVMVLLASACGWTAAEEGGCAEARLKCAYRKGCGAALNNYILWCNDVLRGEPGCPEPCQHALIALTSTDEGKKLMNCECNDDYCQATKKRVEVCRPQVLRASQNETVSCRVSQLICAADALCSTALEYYRSFCKSMFHGKKCTRRCLNSINILRRQEKAAKLATCKCDGLEDYDCPRVQANMARLCFHNYKPKTKLDVPNESPGIDETSSSSTSTTTESQDLMSNEVNSANSKFVNEKLVVLVLSILYISAYAAPG